MLTLQEKHRKMIEHQEKIKPFAPTVKQAAEIWSIVPSAAFYALNRMLKLGAVKYNGRSYYAIPFEWPSKERKKVKQ